MWSGKNTDARFPHTPERALWSVQLYHKDKDLVHKHRLMCSNIVYEVCIQNIRVFYSLVHKYWDSDNICDFAINHMSV